MNKSENDNTKLANLKQRIAELEIIEQKHKNVEAKLEVSNQQLDATNQQLIASENQLKAYNQQLIANEQQLNQQKEAAEHAREFAESIINTVRQPLLVLDSDLVVIAANPYFYSTFRVAEKETLGQLLYNLGNKQWDIPELKKLLKNTLPETSTVEDFEVEHNFEKIGQKIMLLNARELRRQRGKERLILLAIEDITKNRNFEKELIRLNKELEIKAEELQQILYITTHDLRSPLVNIQGFTREMEASLNDLKNLIEKNKFNSAEKDSYARIMEEEIPEAIHYISSSTTKMDNLLKGLLALSRLGRQKLTFRNLDMNHLLNDVLDNFKFEIGQLDVKTEINDLPEIVGDELQINQLFSNLIGNSLKFLDPGRTGKISVSAEKTINGCTLIVEDNGIGIAPEYQEKVFGLFEKLHPEKPGIGLGMNVVKQVIDKHNGTIKLESELGKGTRFIIFIPDLKTNKSIEKDL